MPEPLIYIYADESCLGNQFASRARPGGAGGLVEHLHADRGWVRRDFWISAADTTNNRMAITSAIRPLTALRTPSSIVFTTDSRYLVDGMASWIHGWAARGWRRKGGEIENLALWRELVEAAREHRVEWRWVKGHAGHPQNEYANHLATRAAAEQDASGGLVESAFAGWMVDQQERGRYLEFTPPVPESEKFRPARAVPGAR